ncbi:hypothetical protein QIS74_06680 [Colletotrichum tabaci]|uniref:Uncharacterized protein n=1 Tax=Colletotrichum tabaci TaxID=1209068 RepID=A0AAV9T8Z8_9PEZI
MALPQQDTNTSRQPTDTERDWFYYGLLSQPKLIARTSTTECRHGISHWSEDRKMLTTVGDHDVVEKWNKEPSSLRDNVLDILIQSNIEFETVDILRIGYIDEEMPVVLLISVLPNTLSWADGDKVARECRTALLAEGLDIHCEIKE